jgi:hypothetical protein
MRHSIIECIQRIPLNPMQKYLHDVLASEMVPDAENVVRTRSPTAFGALRRGVTQLIQLVSNPMLLIQNRSFRHDALLGEVIAEGPSPKVMAACSLVRRLARGGLKSIVWTTFRRNVDSVAELLSDLCPTRLHAGLGVERDPEGAVVESISRFRSDKRCFVMVASPSALPNGLEFHAQCQHAIYVDRTYNAWHYRRSLEWSGARGIGPAGPMNIYVLICSESIDENIHARLAAKMCDEGVEFPQGRR